MWKELWQLVTWRGSSARSWLSLLYTPSRSERFFSERAAVAGAFISDVTLFLLNVLRCEIVHATPRQCIQRGSLPTGVGSLA